MNANHPAPVAGDDLLDQVLAANLKAEKLVLLTDTPGILLDRRDPSSLVSSLDAPACRDLIARGIIDEGMIPKVEESLEMLEEGIEAIHIVGISPNDALLHEAEKAGSHGTAFLRG